MLLSVISDPLALDRRHRTVVTVVQGRLATLPVPNEAGTAMPTLRLTALACSLILAIATPLAADAAKKKRGNKPAAAPKPAAITACGDFYAFANADWLKAHPTPVSGGTSALGDLAARARQQQKALLDAAATSPQGTVQNLLGDFWASGIDEASVERDGATPIAQLLGRINAITKNKDIAPAVAALHQVGIPVAFDFDADLDLKNLDAYMGYFTQGGLGLPGPNFYTRSDNDARTLMGEYNGYVQKILVLTGTPQAKAAAEAQLVIDLETRIARAVKVQANAGANAQYAPVAIKEFAKKYRNLQLEAFLKAQGANATQVSMADPAMFAAIDKLVATLKPEQWKAYLRFHIGNAMAPYLSKPWRDADYAFRGRLLRGEETQPERWQQVLDAINASAGSMLAHEYVEKHAPAKTRERAEALAREIRDAALAAVEANTWMDAAAKAEAKSKLEKLQFAIGKPRGDLDFSLQPMGRGSFGSNVMIAKTWHQREEMRKIGRTNADRRWDALPQFPVLSYDLAHNRLFVTAAVLQAPVFDSNQSAASQYGGFGAMVGQQLSHAVVGKGRMVDASGTVRDWWSSTTTGAWESRIAPLAAQFGGYAYPGEATLKVDGTRTREQNSADLSGLELAWAALQKADPQASAGERQAFFRGWARLWSQQLSADASRQHAAFSPHAPGAWRTNGPLMHLPGFAAAFDCKAGNAMQRPAAEQVSIWR
jgi:putative endopeptidase